MVFNILYINIQTYKAIVCYSFGLLIKEDSNLMKNNNIKTKAINPMIYEKTRDGEFLYDVYSRLVKDRIIFLAEELDEELATTITATLLFLDHQNKTKDISIYINSPGGDVGGFYTIYDTMHYIKSPIKTVCIGQASSAAAFILAAGTPGKRFAFENSELMIHEIQVGNMSGTGTEIEKESLRVKKLNEKVIKTLSLHCNQPYDKVKADCKEDKFMTAQEGLEYGLIDGIVKSTKSLPKPKIIQAPKQGKAKTK